MNLIQSNIYEIKDLRNQKARITINNNQLIISINIEGDNWITSNEKAFFFESKMGELSGLITGIEKYINNKIKYVWENSDELDYRIEISERYITDYNHIEKDLLEKHIILHDLKIFGDYQINSKIIRIGFEYILNDEMLSDLLKYLIVIKTKNG